VLAAAPLAAAAPSKAARSVIFLVSDGMSAGVLPLAERFSQLVRQRPTHWHELLRRRDAAHGLFDMASLNSPVTDSAAASSSWGSGVRILNAMVNTLPDGRPLTTLAQLALDAGRRVGLVTTATVTHATPAGLAASQPRRDDEHLIGPQYLGRVDVVLGGGNKFFAAALRKDQRDLSGEFGGRGYGLVRTRQELHANQDRKLLGLFSDGHVPYAIDRQGNAQIPPLAEMAQAALDRLTQHRGGFLLQVEGARVDHAAHNNDIAALLWEQLEFDDAIGVALAHQQKHPDTLIVITSDHGNSNPGLNGTGKEYSGSAESFARVREFRASFDEIARRLGGNAAYAGLEKNKKAGAAPPVLRVREIIENATRITIEAHEAEGLIHAIAMKKTMDWSAQTDNPEGILAEILGNRTGIGWTGTQHTSDYTLVTALGPGAGDFSGLLPNTAAFEILGRQFGTDFRNPSMTLEQANRLRAAGQREWPASAAVHWV
jgi:alkaline phosphatase